MEQTYDPNAYEERLKFQQWAAALGMLDDWTINARDPSNSQRYYSPTLQETFEQWVAVRASGAEGAATCIVCAGIGKLWPADDACHACVGTGAWVIPARFH